MDDRLQVIATAWGDPFAPSTFSGLSRQLFATLEKMGCLAGSASAILLHKRDILDGCYTLARGPRFWNVRLNRRWLWHPRTVEQMSRRLEQKLRTLPPAQAILQVGTHVAPRLPGVGHFCITDMTISEAYRAGMFGLNDLDDRTLRQAVATQRFIFDSCRRVFVLSEWIRQSVIHDCGQSPEQVIVVGAGANLEELEPAPDKYSSRNILFVALEWESKGGPLLVEAFRRVRQQLPDATLTIIGTHPKINAPGVEILGRLHRNVPQEYAALQRAYQRANVFCLLSEFDAFPNVVLEAQYTGTPVVALDRQSRREAVLDGQTGLLVQESRPQPVADALLRILRSSETAAQMGRQGKQFVAARFTWPAVAGRIVEEMTRALQEPVCT